MTYTFPQYRKYKGIDRWFQITSARSFIEISKIGDRYVRDEIQANQFPEKLRIQDMLNCLEDRWEVIDAADFEQVAHHLN
ncbi:MAG: hypothetical protein WDZ35_04470 [Crocinitomicaceae bacterium]